MRRARGSSDSDNLRELDALPTFGSRVHVQDSKELRPRLALSTATSQRDENWRRGLVRRSPPKVGRRHKHPEAVRELDLVDGFPNVVFTFEIGAIVGLPITRDGLAVAGRDGMKDTLRFPHRQRAEHFFSLLRSS